MRFVLVINAVLVFAVTAQAGERFGAKPPSQPASLQRIAGSQPLGPTTAIVPAGAAPARVKPADWRPSADDSGGVLGALFERRRFEQPARVTPVAYDAQEADGRTWLPEGLLYPSYLAGEKEPRMQAVWLSSSDRGVVWETALGGRAGVWRRGVVDGDYPQAFQLDVEGAALARIDHEEESDLEAADFRVGVIGTWREGPLAAKAGYYHLSSHLGDEFLLKNPGFVRLNYVRDSVLLGLMYDLTDELRTYGEVAYALNYEDGAKPLELQYGIEYSDAATGWPGGPFAGINGHTREDFGFITSVNVVAGWQWRNGPYSHRLRLGMQYYDGPALQWSFAGQDESFLGGGLWFDY